MLLTRPPLVPQASPPKEICLLPALDLHVLGTPPAFVLSQDQTSVKSGTSVLYFPPRHSLKLSDGFAYPTFSLLGRTHPSVRIPYPTASPHRSNVHEVVQEYLPVWTLVMKSDITLGIAVVN